MVTRGSIRLVIADDHRLFRDGLKALLRRQQDMEVVGEASTGQETLELLGRLEPEIVLLDVKMPRMDGLEAARMIGDRFPEVRVLILAADATDFIIRQAITAGIAGFMLKESAFEELAEAIRSVHQGQQYLCAQTRAIMAESFRSYVQNGVLGEGNPELSPNDLELVQLLAQGKSIGEIAIALDRSPKTIDARRRKLMNRLGLSSMADLTKFAIRRGLASLDY